MSETTRERSGWARIRKLTGFLHRVFDDLATQVHMSTLTFHHHFQAITAVSPLQYQEWLRLNEARRLMLTERVDAAAAAFRVGYESPSPFSRE